MINKTKIQIFYAFIVMLFLTAGTFARGNTPQAYPDYSGTWDFYFYDKADKVVGAKTLNISDDGSISVKTNIHLDNVVYLTRLSAVVSPNGKVSEGELMYLTNQDMIGTLTGTFTQSEGKGVWKDYMGKSGTWKATRSDKKVKD